MQVTVLSIQVYVTLAPMLWQVAKEAGCKPVVRALLLAYYLQLTAKKWNF